MSPSSSRLSLRLCDNTALQTRRLHNLRRVFRHFFGHSDHSEKQSWSTLQARCCVFAQCKGGDSGDPHSSGEAALRDGFGQRGQLRGKLPGAPHRLHLARRCLEVPQLNTRCMRRPLRRRWCWCPPTPSSPASQPCICERRF